MTGRYGTNYFARALIAAIGWPANLPEDAAYPTTFVDANGAKLNGANKYTLTFPKGLTPPVNGFWSITMYTDDNGWRFYPNPLNKLTERMRNHPKFYDDGSLTLYFHHESPGADTQANWLPAAVGEFLLTLRMYWPEENSPTILPLGKGDWNLPAVQKVKRARIDHLASDSRSMPGIGTQLTWFRARIGHPPHPRSEHRCLRALVNFGQRREG